MKIFLNTENILLAIRLKEHIIKSVKNEIEGVDIATWSYKKSKEGFDIIYHNLPQYVDSGEKNVLFKIELDNSNVILSSVWWQINPEPSDEMICLHVGRLTEMLLRYFRADFVKFCIIY